MELQKALVVLIIVIIAKFVKSESLEDLYASIFGDSGNNTETSLFSSPPTTENSISAHHLTAVFTQKQYVSCDFNKECVPRFLCTDKTITTKESYLLELHSNDAKCSGMDVCCNIVNKITQPINPDCGYRNRRGIGSRILVEEQESDTEFGEFPWMVAILRLEETPVETLYMYECGGALIAPTIVVTAAHCVQGILQERGFLARAGEWDTRGRSETLPHQDRDIKEIVMHEEFNNKTLFNDIALIIVSTPFEWAENVSPICLPNPNTNFDHARCYATGWGTDTFGMKGLYQTKLKKVQLLMVPRDLCQTNLRTTRLGHYFQLDESFICAGGEKGKDTCKGDGGGPLVCPVTGFEDRYFLTGIVAWGISCGVQDIPGVYASVPHLRQWISDNLLLKGIESYYFTVTEKN